MNRGPRMGAEMNSTGTSGVPKEASPGCEALGQDEPASG